jgi:glycosyltransferase involved in cell wall biosynthesis
MRLGINGWRLLSKPTGVPRYVANLVARWRPTNVFGEITLYTPAHIQRDAFGLPSDMRVRLLTSSWPMLVWENLRFAPQADDDVLFCPSFSRPLLARGRTVVATHDMVYRVHPQLFPRSVKWFYSPLYSWSDTHATLVVTDSEAVKDEIAHYCRVPTSRIRVTYLAPAECFAPLVDSALLTRTRVQHLGGDVPFFLFVGKITGRRSVPHLIEAFAEFKRRTTLEHRLLLVGGGTDGPELVGMSRQLGIADVVRHAGFLPDETLNLLYNAATALVSAAVYETSSLPVMEAQATGLPVLCLQNPGMSEITGGAALMIARLDPATLADAMIRMAEDGNLRSTLRTRGIESARRFSWDRCARETMAVLEEAATM